LDLNKMRENGKKVVVANSSNKIAKFIENSNN